MKSKATRNLLVYSIILLSGLSYKADAQTPDITKRQIVIKENTPVEEDKQSYSSALNYVGITLDPLRLISGEIPVTLQYAPLDWLVLEGGAGLTFENQVAEFLFFDSDLTYGRDVNYKLGNMFIAGVKLLPDGDAFLDDYYFGFEYRLRNYASEGMVRSFNQTDILADVNYGVSDFTLVYGRYYEVGKKMFFDLYVGLSYRQVNRRVSSLDPSVVFTDFQENINDLSFGVLYGLRVGLLVKD